MDEEETPDPISTEELRDRLRETGFSAPAILEIFRRVAKVASTNATVLILGNGGCSALASHWVDDLASSANAMLVTLMIPPVAITLGAVVLHERLAPTAFAGFGLLALGLLILDGRILRIARR